MLQLSRILSNELSKKIINWERVRELLDKNRILINEIDDDECTLSDCFDYFDKRGRGCVTLTKLFLEMGFDVSANNGKNGATCLHRLCWSLYDQYIVEVAELLLDAGADPTINLDPEEEDEEDHGVLSSIGFKLGGWDIGSDDKELIKIGYLEDANIFEAYYLMVERFLAGKEYKRIRAFRNIVGSTVQKVQRITKLVMDEDGKIEKRTSYIMNCGDKILEIRDYGDFIVNPYSCEDAFETTDVSEMFKPIIGATIKGLRFKNAYEGKMSFENGYYFIENINEESFNVTLVDKVHAPTY